MDPSASARLAVQLKALAHPARLKVLAHLARSRTCQCGAIVAGLPLAQSTVSQHIRILCDAGLVRGSESPRACYCIDRDALAALRRDLDALFEAFAQECSAGPEI
ncbi:ArsR/SmtB family transcription factor [Aquabacter spiritensis]|nr:metalloregulator ArsR/SmtB family transcription factor [Aquabacter spiritensis]